MHRAFFAAFGLLAATPSVAQSVPNEAGLPSADEVSNRNYVTVGLGVGMTADYEGSDNYRIIPAGAIRGKQGGISFATRGLNLYVDVIPDGDTIGIDAGPIVGVRLNRTGKIKDDIVNLLPDRKTAIEVGGFAGVSFKGLTNPYDALSLRLDVVHDIADSHRSTIVSPNIDFSTPLSLTTFVSASIGADFVANKYADSYFSVSLAESLLTAGELPVYDADGGMKNWKIGLLVNQSLSGDLRRGFSLFGLANYSKLVGDFKDSPIVDLRGSSSQWLGAVGVAYTF